MRQILYLSTAKQLKVADCCLMSINLEEQQQLFYPKDILAVIIENLYCQVTLPALLLCAQNNIPVIICDKKHQPKLYCLDFYQHTLLLERLKEQINWSDYRKQQAWQIIIQQKLQQQSTHLQFIQADSNAISQINDYLKLLNQPVNAEIIDTAESICARIYFSALFGDTFKRFSDDSHNAALNYGYALLRSIIINALVAKGWHPTLGIWHHSVRNRFNFADDIIESLRPLVDHHVKLLALNEQDEFTTAHRHRLLKVLQQKIYWHNKIQHLRYGIYIYLDAVTDFLSGRRESIPTITWDYNHEADTFCIDVDV